MVLSGKDFQEPAAEEVVEEAEAVVLVEMVEMEVDGVQLGLLETKEDLETGVAAVKVDAEMLMEATEETPVKQEAIVQEN